MIDYKEMYFHLMHETARAISLMQKAQQDLAKKYNTSFNNIVVTMVEDRLKELREEEQD